MTDPNSTWKDRPVALDGPKTITLNDERVVKGYAAVIGRDGDPMSPFHESAKVIKKMISGIRFVGAIKARKELRVDHGVLVPRSISLSYLPTNMTKEIIRPMRREKLAFKSIDSAGEFVTNRVSKLERRLPNGFFKENFDVLGWMGLIQWTVIDDPDVKPIMSTVHPYKHLDPVLNVIFRMVGLRTAEHQGIDFRNKMLNLLRSNHGIPRMYSDDQIINWIISSPHLYSKLDVLTKAFIAMGAEPGNAATVAYDLFIRGPSFLSADARGLSDGDLIYSSLDLSSANSKRLVEFKLSTTFLDSTVGKLVQLVALGISTHLCLPYGKKLVLNSTERLERILTLSLYSRLIPESEKIDLLTRGFYNDATTVFGDSILLPLQEVTESLIDNDHPIKNIHLADVSEKDI
jgi:hypothetical protein